MKLELTGAEIDAVDAALVVAHSEWERSSEALGNRAPSLAGRCARRVKLCDAVRYKILVALHGETEAAKIAKERETPPTLEELYNGVPAPTGTRPPCYADNGDVPFCTGTDCVEWDDCHGDKLRGQCETRGALP